MCLLNCFKLYLSAIIFITISFDKSQSWVTDYLFCTQKGLCSCTNSNGNLIDLWPLANRSQPLLAGSNSYLYMYHPCTDLPLNSLEENECKKGYGICYFVPSNITQEVVDFNKVLLNQTLGTFKKLAVNEEAVFRVNGVEELEIVYKNQDSRKIITTIVKLHCNEKIENYELTAEKNNSLEYVLHLTSKYACAQIHHHMSGAAIFFLILLIIGIFYFIGGILVLRFIRGATGVEMIPNHKFWCNIPNLGKGAFNYLKSCGRDSYETVPDSYEKI